MRTASPASPWKPGTVASIGERLSPREDNSAAFSPAIPAAILRVTAVVVTFEGRELVSGCLASLQTAVTAGESMRVLVIDNASSDGTADFVSQEFPDVQVVKTDRNRGYGAACNLAASLSQSEYIAVVNQDVVSMPNWIDVLIHALDTHADAALATPKILIHSDPQTINTCGNAPHYTGVTRCRGYNRPATEYGAVEDIPAVSGAAFVVRRTAFESLGGFDPSFFLYFEDTDLSLRARLAGFRCLYVPGAQVLHDFTVGFSPQKIFFLETNRQASWIKVFHWRSLMLLSPALLLTELAIWGYCLSRGHRHVAAKARSWQQLLKQLPSILRQRQSVQRLRRVRDRDLLEACTSRLELDELEHRAAGLLQLPLNIMYDWWYRRLLESVTW